MAIEPTASSATPSVRAASSVSTTEPRQASRASLDSKTKAMAKDDECAVQVSGLAANVDDGVLMNVFRSHGRIVRIKRDEFNGAYVDVLSLR